MVNDTEIFQQIDQLSLQELRGVIKYLVLLNAEAVQNALNYTEQQRPHAKAMAGNATETAATSVDNSFDDKFTSEFDNVLDEPDEPPLLAKSPQSQDDDAALKPPSSAITPHKPTASFDTNSTDTGATPQISNSRSSATISPQIQLILLCTMKPETNQQAIDQDDAMVFCKHIGVDLPYVVLAENKPEKTLELQQISKITDHYPQFFVSSEGKMEYLGSLNTLRQYKKDGTVTCEQDLYKFLETNFEQGQATSHDQDSDAVTKRQLNFQKQSSEVSSSSSYGGIPEHLQSRKDYQTPQTSDLYEHLLNIAESHDESSPLKKKPDSDDTDGHDKLSESGKLEPPEYGVVLQDKNANREPPAQSPPSSSKKGVRARDGTENLAAPELATVEPAVATLSSLQPATPNKKANIVNTTEPPAMSPPGTTTKAQRRTNLQEKDGKAVSTPNAQVVKRYHVQNSKPEPTPGGSKPRKDPIPLEPPSAREEDPSKGQYVPEVPSPQEAPEDEQQVLAPNGIPGFEENPPSAEKEEQPQQVADDTAPASPPADDQILDILNGVGACYLIYDEQEAVLNIYYSETPMDRAVGVWSSNDITEFKQAQGLGEKEFIGNCATSCQENPGNYFKGWSQFIKAAKSMNGTVITLTKYGMPVEFYTYANNGGDAISEKVPGIQFEMTGIDAVACMPKGTAFDYQTLRARKWSKQAKKLGAVATFNSLVHNTGVSSSSSKPPTPTAGGIPTSLDLPSNPTNESIAAPASTIEVMEQPKDGYPSAAAAPNPEGGACYLVYEPGSSGRLVEQFSKTPVEGAIGRWVPGPGKKIAGFKFKQNHGKSVLIGNCSAGVQGRKNYCSGWNQFVRSARIQKGEVMLWDPADGAKGLPVDVWLYTNDLRPAHQSQMLQRGVSTSVDSILAVSTIPKNTSFFEGMSVDMLKWLDHGNNSGASSKFD